jgi:hypothetical protein
MYKYYINKKFRKDGGGGYKPRKVAVSKTKKRQRNRSFSRSIYKGMPIPPRT